MKFHLLFEPSKLKQFIVPFSFYAKKQKDKTIEIIYSDFKNKLINQEFTKQQASVFSFLSEEEYSKQKKNILANYKKANFNTSEEAFFQKNIKPHFYDSFRKIFSVLSEIQTFHRIQTGENKYTTLACTFDPNSVPILSFKAEKLDGEIVVKIFVFVQDQLFEIDKYSLFEFLILHQNVYYQLRKQDWTILEELIKFESFTLTDFTNKTLVLLKNYAVDTSEVLIEEERNCIPEKIIHVSELGGNMLLFIPKWEYDGYLVDDSKDSFVIYVENRRITYKRNKEIENETIEFLEDAHCNFSNKSSYYLTFEEASHKNWFFNFYHEKLKDNFVVTGMDMLSYFRYSSNIINSEFNVVKTIDNEITAELKVSFGAESISLKTIQKALLEGQKFIVLKDNSLGILTEEWLSQYGIILRYSTINQHEITFSKWVLISSESILQSEKALQLIVPTDWMNDWKAWNNSDENLVEKPKNIQAELRNYQQKGFEWMHLMAQVNAGTLLADDMGLGKTLQTITALSFWLHENPKAKFLVVCPSSLIYNWKNELEKFAPNLNVQVYHGSNRNFDDFLFTEKQILISSYSIVRNDIEKFTRFIWEGIVLDESHNIKNFEAQQTQAILKLAAKKRIILNGTPIMNSVSDLFPQLSFILPQLFNSQAKFKKEFENPIQNQLAEQQMEMLKKLTNPFILRRTKEKVAPDLPQKTESILWCEMNDDQRTAYETIKSQVKQNIFLDIKENGVNKAKLGVLQGITKLRQVCSSPSLLKEETDFQHISSIKVNQLIEQLTSNLKDNKVIIFSQFLGTMELLKTAFKQKGIRFLSFSGSTTSEKRMEMVSEFQDEKSTVQVFLLSLMAGNSGINLTQANYVFLVEPWWNKAVQQQAIDRIHRIGQNQHVFAYNMICKDTIEEKIIALQNKKQFISDEVISTDDNFVKNLSEDDISFLFE